MKLKFNMDVGKKTSGFYNNPSLRAKSLPFYGESGGRMYANKGYFTERDEGANYLLMHTIEGCGYVEYRGDKCKIPKNHCTLVNCRLYHYYKTESDFWDFEWIHFNGTAAEEYHNLINGEGLSVINMEGSKGNLELFDKLFFIMENTHIMTDIKACSIITEIMTRMILAKNNEFNKPGNIKHRSDVDRALKFISENYVENISLNDIVKCVHISKYHFVRIFKEYMTESPYQYLQNYRINMSKKLLTETDIPISEIVNLVGFSDIHNYIKVFKRMVGTTPSDYRRHWVM